MVGVLLSLFFFFFNDTATTEIYTLSLHDALPISAPVRPGDDVRDLHRDVLVDLHRGADPDVHREALARRGRARCAGVPTRGRGRAGAAGCAPPPPPPPAPAHARSGEHTA